MDGLDLRKYQDVESVEDAFGLIVSGKSGYKPIIERRVDPVKCTNCATIIPSDKKFCPSCGAKAVRKSNITKCKKCGGLFEDADTFCGECGSKRE
jgi:RNA polymerase subunit RPABC4/transcription elongation factor Spt4